MILLLSVLVLFLACGVHAQVSSTSYTVFQAVSFNGSNTNTSTGCTNSLVNPAILQCLSVETSKLGDGDVGSLDHLTADNLEHFFAFSRHSTNGFGRTTFNIRSSVSSVVLYFFNSPQDKIGLPHIQVFGSFEEGFPYISYWFDNNNDLNQSDTHLRNVTLNFQRNANISLELAFTFPNNSQIDWLLLSEVILYNDTVGRNVPTDPITFNDGNMSTVLIEPQDFSSTITLSCTVVNSGSFEWQWFHNGTTIDNSQIFIKDATRTSTLIINDFRYANLGNYTCSVNHITDTVYYQRIFTVTEKVNPSVIVTEQSTMVPSSVITISSMITTSSSTVDVLTSAIVDSSHLFTSTSVETVYSSSTTNILTTFTYAVTSTTIEESFVSTTSQSMSTTPSETTAMPPSSSPLIPAVVSIVIVLLIIAVGAVVFIVLLILFVLRRNSKAKSKDDNRSENDYDMAIIKPYSSVDFPAPNNDKPNNNYSYIDAKDEMLYNEIPTSEIPTSRLISTSITLEDNPQYTSADDLDTKGIVSQIYAYPNIPPPIPEYKGSISSLGDVDLNPSHFQPRTFSNDHISPYLHPYNSVYAGPEPAKAVKMDVLKVTMDNVSIIKELGFGQFGKVLLAHTTGLTLYDLGLGSTGTNVNVLVAVKTLQSNADDEERKAFEKEINFMANLRHENVVRILGVCLSSDAFIMMEYMENGDLNQFLQKCDFAPDSDVFQQNSQFLDVGTLVYICFQIASGMRYLAEKNFVHRDLATRNCLVGHKHVVKIADFGMSRHLYDNSYYRISGKALLPIRWMAKECFYGKFSEKTDVWAFGVVMWEVFTFCKSQPYEELADQDVIDNALLDDNKILLHQPHPCPGEVYHVMMRCWVNNTKDRATFQEIHGSLSQIHAYF